MRKKDTELAFVVREGERRTGFGADAPSAEVEVSRM